MHMTSMSNNVVLMRQRMYVIHDAMSQRMFVEMGEMSEGILDANNS